MAGSVASNVGRMETDWGYQLAQAVLDAAVSCGAQCSNRRVTERGEAFKPCLLEDECCELIASVVESVRSTPGTAAKCSMLRVARVELVLRLCWPVPDTDGTRSIVEDSGRAREYSTLRWQILAGIQSAWRNGRLCMDGSGSGCVGAECTPMSVAGWNDRSVEGPCKAYALELEFWTPI